MIKRILGLCLIVCLLFGIMTGCGDDEETNASSTGIITQLTADTTQAYGETSAEHTEPAVFTTVETTEETVPQTTADQRIQFSMDREHVTLVRTGETFLLYSGEIDPSLITWTSDNASVATISGGVVTAVSKGETMVYGEYEGTRSGCKVICNLQDEQITDPTTPTQPIPSGKGPRDPVMDPPSNAVVDASFFDDAAFVGDSISLMLSNYCDYTRALGNATFLVRGSYGVGNEVVAGYHIIYQGVETLLEDALASCGAKKVFIMLGMNDIGLYGVDGTIENWGKLLQRLRAKLPDLQIYIQSMTPVWTGGEVGGLNNTNVNTYNQKLQAFAQANGCKFIDVAPYMRDSTGGLATPYCSDSYVHLTEAGAKAWIQVLMAYTGY